MNLVGRDFFEWSLILRGGVPLRGGVIHRTTWREGNNIPILRLGDTHLGQPPLLGEIGGRLRIFLDQRKYEQNKVFYRAKKCVTDPGTLPPPPGLPPYIQSAMRWEELKAGIGADSGIGIAGKYCAWYLSNQLGSRVI